MAAISAKNVWAVGSLNESSGFVNTFIEHWNGTVWSVVSSPNAPGTNTDNLLGIPAFRAQPTYGPSAIPQPLPPIHRRSPSSFASLFSIGGQVPT
jgi:hypothetical protein